VNEDAAEVASGGGNRLPESTAPEADYPMPLRGPGRARPGRHRDHLFPGRRRRIAPSFSTQEYAAVVAAAARIGLTPTGYAPTRRWPSPPTPPLSHPPPRRRRNPPGEARKPWRHSRRCRPSWPTPVPLLSVSAPTSTRRVRAFNAASEAPVWLRHVVDLCARTLTALDAVANAIHRRLP
jgi:hypothetical protein